MLDVGTGDGLLACGALERLGPSGQVVEFTEHLRPLVESGTGRLRRALAYLAAVKE